MLKNLENLSEEKDTEKEVDYVSLWKELLDLFGTEDARKKFEDLCKNYYKFLIKAKAQRSMDEKYFTIFEKGRAELHNKIMQTIYALMNQVKLDQEKEKSFRSLADRNNVAKMIEDVFGYLSPEEKIKREKMTELGRFRKGDFD